MSELPGAFDLEGFERACFAFRKRMLNDTIDTAAAGAFVERCAELVEVFRLSGNHHFDLAVFGIADPAFEVELAGFAVYEPAEADALDASLN